MFVARQRPLLVLEDRLLALRLSLNTPVLATAELPSGPARAAIFAWAEGSARRYAVAVRALRGDANVIYELNMEVPADADGWAVALDAALSFGESMGFVFDDEVVVDRRPETLRRAVGRLRELITPGEVGGEEPAAPKARIGSPDELAEILLEDELDVLASAPDPVASEASEPLTFVNESPAADPPVALSKFRSPPRRKAPKQAAAPQSPPSPSQTARGAATLGRVRPVRVRVGEDSGPLPDPLLRLLADF